MEDHPGNVQSDLTSRRLPSPAKRNTRWTLLFVGDHGRTVRIKRFKGLFYLAAVLLLVAFGTAAGLYLVNRHTIEENHRLAQETAGLREEVAALRYEKDVLTARLVLTEAELRKVKPPAKPKPAAEEKVVPAEPEDPVGESGSMDASAASIFEEQPSSALSASETKEPPEARVSGAQGSEPAAANEAQHRPVSVENLAVAHEKELSLLRVTFVIRKDDPEPESVSGHAFVVLKPDTDSNDDRWIPLPWAKFESGMPTPPRRGQFFSIARFKPMKFEKTGVADPNQFGQLSVFVFDTGGKLLLKQDFSIEGRLVEAG